MRPLSKSISLGGGTSYAFENPYPGTWYWQVENSEGVSETRMFRITAPDRRSFPVSNPQDGGSIAGNGGVVSWQAGERIARYAVEIVPSGSTWTNPSYRFGTSGTAITLQGVGPGSYDFRVGAFSRSRVDGSGNISATLTSNSYSRLHLVESRLSIIS